MTRNEIKKIAIKLFATKGYSSSTLNDIAKEIGITKAAIYFHFSSKEELFFEILEETIDDYYKYLIKSIEHAKDIGNVEQCLFYIYKRNMEYFKCGKEKAYFLIKYIFIPDEELSERICKVRDEVDSNLKKDFSVLENKLTKPEEGNIRSSNVAYNYYHWFLTLVMLKVLANPDKYTDELIKEEWNIFWQGMNNYC